MNPQKQRISNNPLSIKDSNNSFLKGKAFEDYVFNLFDKKSGRFEFIDAASPNAPVYGFKASQSLFPDLKILCAINKKKYKFAVECKWRQDLKRKIAWAEDYQIENYLNYQRHFGIPVYIAIGIGGHPSKPEKLFLTPVSKISETRLIAEEDLIPFTRRPTRGFFYDAKQLKLF